ncbi:MAG: QueT transporter family protein [Tissierellia bacterium]|nr:QueT transporter family protein [Tissierellia bacterium]
MKAKKITSTALVAAIYLVMTLVFQSISYGPIQFRVAEVLNLLAFYNPAMAPGIVLGVFLSNLSSPLGAYDLVFGTFHTAISLYGMTKSRSLYVASLWPTLFSFIIGFELTLAFGGGLVGFASMTGSVMLSEFIICSLISIPLYRILEDREIFQKLITR